MGSMGWFGRIESWLRGSLRSFRDWHRRAWRHPKRGLNEMGGAAVEFASEVLSRPRPKRSAVRQYDVARSEGERTAI